MNKIDLDELERRIAPKPSWPYGDIRQTNTGEIRALITELREARDLCRRQQAALRAVLHETRWDEDYKRAILARHKVEL